MELIKSVIFTACICAIMTAAVEMFSPERMKKQLSLVCGLVLIIGTAGQLIGENINISSNTRLFSDKEYKKLDESYKTAVNDETSKAIEATVFKALEEQNISVKKVGIVCTADEYNCVRADKADIVVLRAEDIKRTQELAGQLLPETSIEVTADE